MEIKRLFFGMEIVAPWPEQFPAGRLLSEADRHVTLAFLGDANLPELQAFLPTFPKPSFPIGLAGYFDQPVFLPFRAPRVAAWHVRWFEGKELFDSFQKKVMEWLKRNDLSSREKKGEFLAHVTIARRPFALREWKKEFVKLPLFSRNIHLCESLGNSQYEVCWSLPILSPFEEIEHTADIAFIVRGENFSQLLLHAALALSFHFPPLLRYFPLQECTSLEKVISAMNEIVSRADAEIGSPFKAVSYSSGFKETPLLEWEMIVDV